VTPLSEVQTKILFLLDIPTGIYTQLAINFSKPISKMTEP
jgi:hypothetical protein